MGFVKYLLGNISPKDIIKGIFNFIRDFLLAALVVTVFVFLPFGVFNLVLGLLIWGGASMALNIGKITVAQQLAFKDSFNISLEISAILLTIFFVCVFIYALFSSWFEKKYKEYKWQQQKYGE